MGEGQNILNQVISNGKNFLKQYAKKAARMILMNPFTYIVLGIMLIIIIIVGSMVGGNATTTANSEGYNNIGQSNFSGQELVEIAKNVHNFLKENYYAYSCRCNVGSGYSNECDDCANCTENCGTSYFGKNNFEEYDNIKCIDCSAFVSWVLNQYLGDANFSTRWWSGDFANQNKWLEGWEKIDIDEIQPGDILWKEGHVGIYIGEGKTVEAGSTRAIRADYSFGSLQSVMSNYEFAIRIH